MEKELVILTTVFGKTIIGLLEDLTESVLIVENPLALALSPNGQAMQITLVPYNILKPLCNVNFLRENLESYSIVKDPTLLQQYTNTIDQLRAQEAGITLAGQNDLQKIQSSKIIEFNK